MDTLGRWMAHHIAELIRAAEDASDAEGRREKKALAAETIMKLWSHRSQYENRINPLSDLKPIIQVLRTLDPNQNNWATHLGLEVQQVYDAFRRLMICLLLMRVSIEDIRNALNSAKTTAKFHASEEKEIIASIEHWLDDRQRDAFAGKSKEGKAKQGPAKSRKASKSKQGPATTLDEITRSLITDARTALDRLTEELDRPVPAVDQGRKS